MVHIKFRYRDSYSDWEWRNQECTVESVAECIKIYGLDESDVDYEIVEVKRLNEK